MDFHIMSRDPASIVGFWIFCLKNSTHDAASEHPSDTDGLTQ